MLNEVDVIYGIRILLDDSREWFFKDVVAAINEAQIKLIYKYYSQHDERALRPLYAYDNNLKSGDIVQDLNPYTSSRAPAEVLFPRKARIYFDDNNTTPFFSPDYFVDATYLEPNHYFKYFDQITLSPFATGVNNDKNKAAYYTIQKTGGWNNFGFRDSRIYINLDPSTNYYIEIFYIRKPKPFEITTNTQNQLVISQGLELENLYFPELVGLAAEILNTQDVTEVARGDFFNVYAGDRKLTLENSLSLIQVQRGD